MRAAQRFGACIALKGAHTVLADPEGTTAICAAGNPGMATAGSGDVLTGIAGAVLARRGGIGGTADRARLAVFLHARAGDLAAEETGAVLFVHPATRGLALPVFGDYYLWNSVANPVETTIAAAHLVMAGVLERHPALKIVLAHGGGALWAVRGRLRRAHAQVPAARSRLREAPDASLARLYHDTVTHDPALLRRLIEDAGPDHVLLGSDRPFDMGIDDPRGTIAKIPGLDDGARAAILGENARSFLSRYRPPSASASASSR